MRVTLWGTRGSIPTPGPETARYGGDTSCVEVRGPKDALLVLDAGTGIRRLGATIPGDLPRVDVLLTHLHMDHILGLGFFAPLFSPATEVHVWGPPSTTQSLHERLRRYLSPPLFPVHLRDLIGLTLHDLPCKDFDLGPFHISSAFVCHPGPTVGYRITADNVVLAYLPDHEPALGVRRFPLPDAWTSGCTIAADADLLLHDAQFSEEEYLCRVGWGHSSFAQAVTFARLMRVRRLVPFHHDPGRTDAALDRLLADALSREAPDFPVTPGAQGDTFSLGGTPASTVGRAQTRQKRAA
jgi:ribonuclease BN (tRNA processing enzyme)